MGKSGAKGDATRICKAVKRFGGEAWYVGGYVRDKLIAQQNSQKYSGSADIDIEVFGLSERELESCLESISGTSFVKVGRAFPVYTSTAGVDVSLPRAEVGDGIHHGVVDFKVDPTMLPEQAMKRRDFTINTFMREGAGGGKLLACVGAFDDLKHGIIRHQNNKFSEDPLRVFRAARFASQFDFTIAPETIELCRMIDTSHLSRERVAWETIKALHTKRPSKFFYALKEMGQLKAWFPELDALIDCTQPEEYHPEGDVFTHTMLALDYAAQHHMGQLVELAVLCHDLGKPNTKAIIDGVPKFRGHGLAGVAPASALLKRLCVKNTHIHAILPVVEHHMDVYNLESSGASQKSWNKLFDKVYPELLLHTCLCDRNSKGLPPITTPEVTEGAYIGYCSLNREQEVTAPDLIVSGLKPSPAFAEALGLAHKMWLSLVSKEEALPQVIAFAKRVERRYNVQERLRHQTCNRMEMP